MTDQKHYPMPALTEQEREDLVKYLTASIEDRCIIMRIRDTLRMDRQRNEIAMAVLTAPKPEPTYYEAKANGIWGSVTKSHYEDCKKFGVPTRLLFAGGEE